MDFASFWQAENSDRDFIAAPFFTPTPLDNAPVHSFFVERYRELYGQHHVGCFPAIDMMLMLNPWQELPDLNTLAQILASHRHQTDEADLEAHRRKPTHQRYNTKVACGNCHRQKLRCDINRPCGRCVQAGRADTCCDRQHQKKGRKRKQKATTAPSSEQPTSSTSFLKYEDRFYDSDTTTSDHEFQTLNNKKRKLDTSELATESEHLTKKPRTVVKAPRRGPSGSRCSSPLKGVEEPATSL